MSETAKTQKKDSKSGPQTYSERRLLEIAEAAEALNTRVGLMLALNLALIVIAVIGLVIAGAR